jgi:hypothetical protein
MLPLSLRVLGCLAFAPIHIFTSRHGTIGTETIATHRRTVVALLHYDPAGRDITSTSDVVPRFQSSMYQAPIAASVFWSYVDAIFSEGLVVRLIFCVSCDPTSKGVPTHIALVRHLVACAVYCIAVKYLDA